jgi:hypothetical protein
MKIAAIAYVTVVLALIAAKLLGYLHTAWLIVLIPLWLPPALFIVFAVIAIAFLGGAMDRGENPFR